MRAIAAIVGFLAVAGCDEIPRARSETEIREMARQVHAADIQRLDRQIMTLESRLAKEEAFSRSVQGLALAAYDQQESLRKTFNHNVDLNNAAKVASMTARGACGQEWVRYPDGGQVWRNKVCTIKDLRP